MLLWTSLNTDEHACQLYVSDTYQARAAPPASTSSPPTPTRPHVWPHPHPHPKPHPSQPELCSIVNSVLRDDIDSPMLEAAVVFTVVLNKFTNAVRRCAACNGRAARTLERRVRASPLV